MQGFRQGELFEIVMLQGVCHRVIDLDDVPQGCELIFQEGWGNDIEEDVRGKEGKAGREKLRLKEFLHVPTLCIIVHAMC